MVEGGLRVRVRMRMRRGSVGEDSQLCPRRRATDVCVDEINEIIHREVSVLLLSLLLHLFVYTQFYIMRAPQSLVQEKYFSESQRQRE